jgi:hypothetical protein
VHTRACVRACVHASKLLGRTTDRLRFRRDRTPMFGGWACGHAARGRDASKQRHNGAR